MFHNNVRLQSDRILFRGSCKGFYSSRKISSSLVNLACCSLARQASDRIGRYLLPTFVIVCHNPPAPNPPNAKSPNISANFSFMSPKTEILLPRHDPKPCEARPASTLSSKGRTHTRITANCDLMALPHDLFRFPRRNEKKKEYSDNSPAHKPH